ncbi:hypothetical protein K470DRAFT_255701 [Piedraia hortae CBS 480.64]|uniref:BZIP domain-containing protein n=1 Tax=Piedraia hortae CBS 480.64 TaxID=1314780 RepID=A0A6A7C5S3_9PEZI|nr:hypothetical protein K470DRAFT_255701 [Piedraia hortae CBS 480.64]
MSLHAMRPLILNDGQAVCNTRHLDISAAYEQSSQQLHGSTLLNNSLNMDISQPSTPLDTSLVAQGLAVPWDLNLDPQDGDGYEYTHGRVSDWQLFGTSSLGVLGASNVANTLRPAEVSFSSAPPMYTPESSVMLTPDDVATFPSDTSLNMPSLFTPSEATGSTPMTRTGSSTSNLVEIHPGGVSDVPKTPGRNRQAHSRILRPLVADPNDRKEFKKAKNTAAARKSRAKKKEHLERQEQRIEELEAELENAREVAAKWKALVPEEIRRRAELELNSLVG